MFKILVIKFYYKIFDKLLMLFLRVFWCHFKNINPKILTAVLSGHFQPHWQFLQSVPICGSSLIKNENKINNKLANKSKNTFFKIFGLHKEKIIAEMFHLKLEMIKINITPACIIITFVWWCALANLDYIFVIQHTHNTNSKVAIIKKFLLSFCQNL